MIEYLGWSATAVFVSSYFCRSNTMRWVQVVGAAMWMVYGGAIRAWPVLVANGLVLAAAAWTATRRQPA